jgi:hypothetical protein
MSNLYDLPDELLVMICIHVFTGFQILPHHHHKRYRSSDTDNIRARYSNLCFLLQRMPFFSRWRLIAHDVYLRENEFKLVDANAFDDMHHVFQQTRARIRTVTLVGDLLSDLIQQGVTDPIWDDWQNQVDQLIPRRHPVRNTLPLEALVGLEKIVWEYHLDGPPTANDIRNFARVLGARQEDLEVECREMRIYE